MSRKLKKNLKIVYLLFGFFTFENFRFE